MKSFAKFALPSKIVGSTSSSSQSGLGFGCMGITAFYGTALPDDEALKLLRAVYDTGCRHYDTAEVYAAGGKYNESILGDFFQTVPRDSYSVATKYYPMPDDPNVYSYDSVKTALVASLKRLQLEYVDLYYAHRVLTLDGGMKFADTAKRLKEEGLVKEVGLSEVSGKWLREIHTKGCPIDAIQQEWSLLTRNLEDEVVPVCKELDIPIVAYSPLSRNLLATKVEEPPTDWRASQPRYSKENLAANQKVLDKVHELSAKYNCTSAAQIALSWLFHKAAELNVTVIPIPGTTKLQNVTTNVGSVHLDISPEDSHILESLASQIVGARGNEQYISRAIESQK